MDQLLAVNLDIYQVNTRQCDPIFQNFRQCWITFVKYDTSLCQSSSAKFCQNRIRSFNQIPCICVITALLRFPVREYLEYALRLRCLVLIPSCAMRITEKLLLFLWTSVISSSLQVSFIIFKNILRICYKPTCFSFGKIGLYLDVYHSGVFFSLNCFIRV